MQLAALFNCMHRDSLVQVLQACTQEITCSSSSTATSCAWSDHICTVFFIIYSQNKIHFYFRYMTVWQINEMHSFRFCVASWTHSDVKFLTHSLTHPEVHWSYITSLWRAFQRYTLAFPPVLQLLSMKKQREESERSQENRNALRPVTPRRIRRPCAGRDKLLVADEGCLALW